VCKGFGTDLGVELSSLALQIHGGLGFIEETGVAQHYRDVRIAPIYEGTNGIQAADLIGRKLPVRNGQSVLELLQEIGGIDAELAAAGDAFAGIRAGLATNLGHLQQATQWMMTEGLTDPDAALSGSSPYLRMWGHVLGAWFLAQSALAAAGTGDAALAETKLVLARFYAEQLLPAVAGLLPAATGGSADLFALDAAQLAS
jgi:3-(methylthio)propanoyl-CoA dehydrogenase